MSAVLSFALSYPREIAIGALVLVSFFGVRGCVDARDDRIRAEALYEERLADFQTADSAYSILATETQARLEKLRQDSLALASRLDSAEAETEALREAAEQASQRSIETGETLAETLRVLNDSTALRQWREHVAADRRERQAHREDKAAIAEERDLWKTAAEQANEWGSEQYNLRIATERALEEARDALEAGAPAHDGHWTDHWTIKAAALIGAGYTGYRLGASGS